MGNILTRRREMVQTGSSPTPVVPDGYKQIEYVYSTNSKAQTGVLLNGTDEADIKVGMMATATTTYDYPYFLISRQASNNNSIGLGLAVTKNLTDVLIYGGATCSIQPNGGSSIIDMKLDIVAHTTRTTLSITDGTHSNTISLTRRGMALPLSVFAIDALGGGTVQAFKGRIYYVQVTEANVPKLNLIPCRKIDDSTVGFWDTVQNTFITSTGFSAGPDV